MSTDLGVAVGQGFAHVVLYTARRTCVVITATLYTKVRQKKKA